MRLKRYETDDFATKVIEKTAKGMLSCNRNYLSATLRRFAIDDVKNNTIYKYVCCLRPFLRFYISRDLKTLTKTEIEDFIIYLMRSRFAPATKEDVKRALKRFYKELGMGDLVGWIKVNRKSHGIPAEKLLNMEEVTELINGVGNLRDKAIIAVSYDGGLRPCELLGLKIMDIDLAHSPTHITVSGKTGARTIPLTFSTKHLSDYISATPRLDINSTIWIRQEMSNSKGALGHRGLLKMLHVLAAKIAFKKKLYPYVFRHSRFTEYAKFMTNQQLIKFFGTHQIETYSHLIVQDLDNCLKEEEQRRITNSDGGNKLNLILKKLDRLEEQVMQIQK